MVQREGQRTIGLVSATGIGVGAIVGGGILALAGPAFMQAGPAAVLAFALNAVIAVITALTFAELATRFPESGGTYAFARRVLPLEPAFAVGWVVWFASIVAAVLYGLGFGAFADTVIAELWRAFGGEPPEWITGRWADAGLAAIAAIGYTVQLLVSAGGSGHVINALKLLMFAVLVVGGAISTVQHTVAGTLPVHEPFLPFGVTGLVSAMGLTFIAMQGFDLIAAVGGEVKQPERNLPRAMLFSLGIAVAVYIPLLWFIDLAGTDANQSIVAASTAAPDTLVARAAQHFLGPAGYWLVLGAGVLAMLSALQANLLAASRVAEAMARDRTLPRRMERRGRAGTPVRALAITGGIVVVVTLVVGDVASAGAAASLIFLVTFALVHVIAILARRRLPLLPGAFRIPFYPYLPIFGAVACTALSLYQAFAVPAAGAVTGVWMALGAATFLGLFAKPARVRDAASVAADPHLARLRGRSPLVLVPLANPRHAGAMVEVAHALAPPSVGRVLLLSVVRADAETRDDALIGAVGATQAALAEALVAAHERQHAPEALSTIAQDPWGEILRVARTHRCESVLLGLGDLDDEPALLKLEHAVGAAGCDAVVLRAPNGWTLDKARKVLIPVAGRGGHDILRARLVASLLRMPGRTVSYLRVLPENATKEAVRRAHLSLTQLNGDEAHGRAETIVALAESAPEEIIERASEHDMLILGFQRQGRQRLFGPFARRIARETSGAIVGISHRA